MKILFTTLTVAALLSACATPYQPTGVTGGFEEMQIDANVWRISFRGNGYTREWKAEDYCLLRSAELTLANGYSHFAIADAKTSTSVSGISTPSSSYTTGTVHVNGNNAVGSSTTTNVGGGTTFISRPRASNIVMMFKGKPNTDGIVYDAALVCSSLGQKYKIVCNQPKS